MTRKPSRISEEARKDLYARVEAMRSAESDRATQAQPDAAPGRDATDFSTLPGYEELRAQLAIGEKAGIGNPYFRMHDGLAGARTIIDGRTVLNFSCYDYLGLNGHPEIVQAAKEAIDRYGISASGSRVVSGERAAHRSLELALASHYGAEDCLVQVSGYATNLGVIGQLLGPKDLLIYDATIHNSVLMGGLLSGAARRSFRHNDLDNLEQVLSSIRGRFERALIVVEGVYSMDGDCAELPRLIEIKNRYNSWLMVDEAHALGVIGRRGFGLAEHFDLDPNHVDIWMGTLSKTMVACGGYIAGRGEMVEYMRCMSPTFVYSVGTPPLIAAAAEKALEIMHREPQRVVALQRNAALFHELAKKRRLDVRTDTPTAVCPVWTGDSLPAALLSHKLFERGINVQPVMYPGVPAKESRLRFFLTSMHEPADIEQAIDATAEELAKMPETLQAFYNAAIQR